MTTMTRSASGASAYSGAPGYSMLGRCDAAGDVDSGAPVHAGSEWSPIIDELLRIRSLEDDWDGEGSNAPHPALVDGAITLAQALQERGFASPDRVHSGVNATVYFEWHAPLGYTEIEVVSPTGAEWRSIRKGTDQTEVVYLSRLS